MECLEGLQSDEIEELFAQNPNAGSDHFFWDVYLLLSQLKSDEV